MRNSAFLRELSVSALRSARLQLDGPGLGVTGFHEQTHCIGNVSEAGFEVQSEKSNTLFSRMRCPSGFGPGSHHLSFNITTVVQSAPGSLPASSLASDSVSQSECYERFSSVIPFRRRGRFVGRDSVHVLLFGHFNRCICRPHRTVCHRCKFR